MTAVSTVAPRKIFYNANRQRISTLCVVSASWKLDFGWKFPATFFARPESFQIFAFRFSTQFSQSKSTIKIHEEFQEFWIFKQAKFRAKKKEMSWSKWEF
jgi:hypothetical protein